jgi:hypothetical protein
MGHRAAKRHPDTKGLESILTRSEYSARLYATGKIDLAEFEKRVDYLLETGKEDAPYIVDAGPGGFKYS